MNQNKKILISTAIITILLSTLSFLPATVISQHNPYQQENNPQQIEEIHLTFTAPTYQLSIDSDQHTQIYMNDFGSLLRIGYPKLPSTIKYISLPAESTIIDIIITDETIEPLPGNHIISQTPAISDSTTTYNSETTLPDTFYPQYPVVYEGMGSYGSIPYAKIRFTPFSYHPIDQLLQLHQQINLTIRYHISSTTTQHTPLTDHVIGKDISTLITNQSYTSPLKTSTQPLDSALKYDYLIITTPQLEQSVLFLKEWRELTGYQVKIVNTTYIETHYQGIDLAQKIRSFLKDRYQVWQIKYVLLVGSIKTIPMRNGYPDANNHGYSGKVPTDYYYADLTGEWDSDNDGYFGERTDDNPDFSAEITVGRIPHDDPDQIDAICQKIIDFEKTDAPWKKQALLIGAFLFLDNQDHDASYKDTDGAELMEDISKQILQPHDFQITTLYEKEGLTTSTYDSDYYLTRENVTEQWNQGFGLVNWNGHGSASSTSRVVWRNDDGDNVPERNEISSPLFINSYDSNSLMNTKPAIVFSCSCQNAYPERSNNLGAELLKNGAVAFIGATRNAWGSVEWKDVSDGGASSLDYLFTKEFISNDLTVGKALYYAKFNYLTEYDWDSWQSIQNLYDFNVYGDPATSFQTITGLAAPNTPSLPQGTETGPILSDITFRSSSTDPDHHSLYYQWEWGDGSTSQWMGPYNPGEEMEAIHQWVEPGSYEIRVRSRDITGEKSNYSEAKTIQISSPQLSIRSISSSIGGVQITFENTGDYPANKLDWTVTMEDGIALRSQSNGYIPHLDVGEQITVTHRFIFGFGLPTITISYQSEKLSNEIDSATGLVLGPIIII